MPFLSAATWSGVTFQPVLKALPAFPASLSARAAMPAPMSTFSITSTFLPAPLRNALNAS